MNTRTFALAALLATAAGSAHAEVTPNAITLNAITLNAITLNAITLNAITLNAITLNGVDNAQGSLNASTERRGADPVVKAVVLPTGERVVIR